MKALKDCKLQKKHVMFRKGIFFTENFGTVL